jgi:hypothetical protein
MEEVTETMQEDYSIMELPLYSGKLENQMLNTDVTINGIC